MPNDISIFSAMQSGKPYAQYRKTILGQVCVQVLNPFKTGESQYILLKGEPGTEDSIVKVWSVEEDVFFKRMNRRHFQSGNVIPHAVEENTKPEETPIEQMSDEELQKIINQKFFGFQNALNKITTIAPLSRILSLAEEMEKSERIIGAIKARLAEVQMQEYKAKEE